MDLSHGDSELLIRSERGLSFITERIFAKVVVDNNRGNLKKVLGLFQLIFLGASCAIGAGAYSIIGIAATLAGPGIVVSFLVVGFMTFFTCLPFAEFAAKIQSSGFSYSFAYATCGEIIGYLVGHSLHLIQILAAAISAKCLGSYIPGFISLYGINVPTWFYDLEFHGMRLCIFGALIVVGFTVLMLVGMKDSTNINNIVSITNIITLVFLIFAGLVYLEPGKYYADFFPKGVDGVLAGMGLAFYAYGGFEGTACFTEEAINPDRDIPIALIVVLLLTIVLNSGVALVITGLAPYALLGTNKSLLEAFKLRCPQWISTIISLGSIAGLASSTSGMLMCQPRVFFSMSYDRLLPKIFMQLNPKTQAPEFAIIVTGCTCAVATLFFDIRVIGNAVSLGGLFIFTIIDLAIIVSRYETSENIKVVNHLCVLFGGIGLCFGISVHQKLPLYVTLISGLVLVGIAVMISKHTQTSVPQSFRCPYVPMIPLFGAFTLLIIISAIDINAWIIFLIYMSIGIVAYFGFGFSSSKLNRYRVQSSELPEHKELSLLSDKM